MSWNVKFSDNTFKTINWNLTIEKTQKPWNFTLNMVCQGKAFNNDDIFYIVEKDLKIVIQC